MNKVIRRFTDIVPLDKQEKIDQTKSQCPVCYMRRDYKNILKEIVKEC